MRDCDDGRQYSGDQAVGVGGRREAERGPQGRIGNSQPEQHERDPPPPQPARMEPPIGDEQDRRSDHGAAQHPQGESGKLRVGRGTCEHGPDGHYGHRRDPHSDRARR